MKSVKRLPHTASPCGWNALLAPRTPRPALEGDKHCDIAVIGGGYAGVAAARRLAAHNPGIRIALLEAHLIGENAAGKNSGFAIDLPHYSDNNVAAAAYAKTEILLWRRTLAELETLISQYGIDCDWQRAGRYHAAVTAAVGAPLLDNYRRNLEQWEESYRDCDTAALEQELGSRYYHSAVFTAGTYLLNPAALIRGLADSLPAQVAVYEQSPVTAFDWRTDEKILRTPQGSIRCGKVIVAVNSFLAQFGLYRLRQVPMVLYATLTEPLDDGQMVLMGSVKNWGITPAHGTVGPSLRLTADRRLLIRHGFAYSPRLHEDMAVLDTARNTHMQMLAARFPQLRLKAEHTWMGWLPISHNHMPIFGKAARDVFVISCCNGAGVVRHSAGGALIADLALGIDNPDTATYTAGGQASLLPPRPFVDVGIKAVAGWELYRGRREL